MSSDGRLFSWLVLVRREHGGQNDLDVGAFIIGFFAQVAQDRLVELCFLARDVVDGDVDRFVRDELVDSHGFGLANAMASVHGLNINRRVPVQIMQNDRVGRGQIDAQPARPGA